MKKYVVSRKDVCAGQLLRVEHPNIQMFGLESGSLVPINVENSGIKIYP